MSHRVAFVVLVGLAMSGTGWTQEPPAKSDATPKEFVNVAAWANSPDDLECRLIALYVSPSGKEMESERARCTLFHDGVVQIESLETDKTTSIGPDGKDPKRETTSVALYRKGDRVVVQHLDGHWTLLSIKDFDPETHNDGNTSFASSFSRNLVTAVGGPALPNPRAGTALILVRVKDPRVLVRDSMENATSTIEPGATSVTPSKSPIGVDLATGVVKDFFGAVLETSNGRVLLHGSVNGVVKEADLLLHAKVNQVTKKEDPAFWESRLVFKDLRIARDAKVPDEVLKLLDAAEAKPAK